MPRIGRKKLQTTFFHIIVQGINKEYIFYNEEYIKEYKKLLLDNLNKYNVKIIAYCIMNNHTHILLYTENIEEMSKYMKSINTSYAKYYNRNENRVGIVFRNRYESEPIYEKRYLLNCIGYIHNNPVKAGISERVEDYKYSSYNDYIYAKGIAQEDVLKLVFGSKKGYLDIYSEIHKTKHQFNDYKKDIDYKEKYNSINQINVQELLTNKIRLKETIKELVQESQIPINKVSELLGISRFKVSRILKQK